MSFTDSLLIATPLIRDPYFFHTVVYIYAHDPVDGAAGIVLNRPTPEPAMKHLPGWRSVLAAPPMVFWGGPVTADHGSILTVEGDRVSLADELEPPQSNVRARLFVGQAGWAPGQLEAEVAEGAWLAIPASPKDVLSPFADNLWSDLLRRQGGQVALWATHPVDPGLN